MAEKIGGDIKKTEIDLLDRLLKRKDKREVEVKAESESSLNQRFFKIILLLDLFDRT